jgi:hypothetical protein
MNLFIPSTNIKTCLSTTILQHVFGQISRRSPGPVSLSLLSCSPPRRDQQIVRSITGHSPPYAIFCSPCVRRLRWTLRAPVRVWELHHPFSGPPRLFCPAGPTSHVCRDIPNQHPISTTRSPPRKQPATLGNFCRYFRGLGGLVSNPGR